MNWLYIHLPFAGIDAFIPTLLLMGFSVGVISSFLGIGGAWMMTPALNIMGFPMTYAIGTDIAHVAGKSLFATLQHSRFGNVDFKLAFVMVIGTIIGVEIGAQIVMYLESFFLVEHVVRWVYMFFLAFISLVMFFDYKKLKSEKASKKNWHEKLHKIKIPPMITFRKAGVTCSIWLPVIVSIFTGIVAGFLGIGGGLLRLPALIYLVGCPTIVAVGTDLFEVMISGIYGAFTYTMKGRVDYIAMLIMLTSASIGTQIGALATKYTDAMRIRFAFGVAVTTSLFSIFFKQMGWKILSEGMIFGIVGLLTAYILLLFWTGSKRKKPETWTT